tara:strand:+ start:15374 stop:15583 length:210 start_codon:yes stop_codon:yes gene_type:complete
MKAGFSEQDVVDAADAILEQEPNPYVNGVYNGKSSKVVKESPKESKARKASYEKGREQVKAKSKKGKKA